MVNEHISQEAEQLAGEQEFVILKAQLHKATVVFQHFQEGYQTCFFNVIIIKVDTLYACICDENISNFYATLVSELVWTQIELPEFPAVPDGPCEYDELVVAHLDTG